MNAAAVQDEKGRSKRIIHQALQGFYKNRSIDSVFGHHESQMSDEMDARSQARQKTFSGVDASVSPPLANHR